VVAAGASFRSNHYLIFSRFFRDRLVQSGESRFSGHASATAAESPKPISETIEPSPAKRVILPDPVMSRTFNFSFLQLYC